MTNILIDSEISESLHQQMQKFIESSPDWTHDRLVEAAIALFLLNNPSEDLNKAVLTSALIAAFPNEFERDRRAA